MDSATDDDRSRNLDMDRTVLQLLEETQQSWLLGPSEKKKKKYVDLGCMVCSRKLFCGIIAAVLLTGFITLLVKTVPQHHSRLPLEDNYTEALHKAMLFFNAQKSTDDDRSRNLDMDRTALQLLEETQQSWLLGPSEKKKKKYVDLGCMVCSRKLFCGIIAAVLLTGFITLLVKTVPQHHSRLPLEDNYTQALHKAMLFFNAQKFTFQERIPTSTGFPGFPQVQDAPTETFGRRGLYICSPRCDRFRSTPLSVDNRLPTVPPSTRDSRITMADLRLCPTIML
ncbi:hypothetical protein GOP47_0004941 [Adiantum capillus-veneris]|uniref:Uncharacterized protein n=1 Tax=Adiantum capillus-veneris TaxID=13818 RepID=A0A9D4ZMS4_ADICA|nr:hypothetical protein GOP47_0004941 [Adiantum capillus-veneris]